MRFKFFLAASALAMNGCALIQPDKSAKPEIPASTEEQTTLPAQEKIIEKTEPAEDLQVTDLPERQPSATEEPLYYPNVWDELRAGFRLPSIQHRYVTEYERAWSSRPDHFARLVKRAHYFLPYIVEQVKQQDMPLEIALVPAIESDFSPLAYSRSGAAGLWQFMPATGRQFGLRETSWYAARKDVVNSTRAALDYFSSLEKQFKGDWFLALAAYNAGENRIKKSLHENSRNGKPLTFSHLRLKYETARYVPKLIAFRNIVLDPERYGLKLRPMDNKSYFSIVDCGRQCSLESVARISGTSVRHLKKLNPALSRGVTPPGGPHQVLVPAQKHDALVAELASLETPAPPSNWQTHTVKKGEVLGVIAQRYGVRVSDIREANGLKSDRLSINQELAIPVRGGPVINPGIKQSTKTTHTVRNGDTLWGIARAYKVQLANLLTWNQLRKSSILRPGQQLIVANP